jgi:hypothetical protein
MLRLPEGGWFARVATGVPSRNCSAINSQADDVRKGKNEERKSYLDLLVRNSCSAGHHL